METTPTSYDTTRISELAETTSRSLANKAISEGWILLKVLSKSDEGEFAAYVLGWEKENGTPTETPHKDHTNW